MTGTVAARHSPLEGFVAAFERVAATTDGALSLAELPFLAQLDLRADPGDAALLARLGAAAGVDLPTAPNTSLRPAAATGTSCGSAPTSGSSSIGRGWKGRSRSGSGPRSRMDTVPWWTCRPTARRSGSPGRAPAKSSRAAARSTSIRASSDPVAALRPCSPEPA